MFQLKPRINCEKRKSVKRPWKASEKCVKGREKPVKTCPRNYAFLLNKNISMYSRTIVRNAAYALAPSPLAFASTDIVRSNIVAKVRQQAMERAARVATVLPPTPHAAVCGCCGNWEYWMIYFKYTRQKLRVYRYQLYQISVLEVFTSL